MIPSCFPSLTSEITLSANAFQELIEFALEGIILFPAAKTGPGDPVFAFRFNQKLRTDQQPEELV